MEASSASITADTIPFLGQRKWNPLETLSWWGAGGCSIARRIPAPLRPHLGQKVSADQIHQKIPQSVSLPDLRLNSNNQNGLRASESVSSIFLTGVEEEHHGNDIRNDKMDQKMRGNDLEERAQRLEQELVREREPEQEPEPEQKKDQEEEDNWEDEDLELMTPRHQDLHLPITKPEFMKYVAQQRKTQHQKLPNIIKVRRGAQRSASSANEKNVGRWRRCLSYRAQVELGILSPMNTTEQKAKSLQKKDLSNICSGDVNEPLIARGLSPDGRLSFANLSIGPQRLRPIAKNFKHMHLTQLNLENCLRSTTRNSLSRTLEYISGCDNLISLNISNNRFRYNNTTGAGIAKIIANCGSLERLFLRSCHINASAIQSMTMSFHKSSLVSSSLRLLDLRDNRVGDKGMSYLSNAMENVFANIEHLFLDDNNISSKGIKILSEGICSGGTSNKILQRLTLALNPIHESGETMADMLTLCVGLTDLDLSWTGLSNLGERFREALSASTSLLHLTLSHNGMDTEEVSLFSEALSNNHTLLGCHISCGNSASMDYSGRVYSTSTTRTLAGLAVDGDVCADGSHVASEQCWLCEGWREVEFVYVPGSANTSGVKFLVEVCLATEGWKPHPMKFLPPSNDESPGKWVLSLVLPPKRHRFLFRIDEKGYEFCSNIQQTQARLWPTGPKLQVNYVDVKMRRPGTTLRCKEAKPRMEVCAKTQDDSHENSATKEKWSVTTSIFCSRMHSVHSGLYLSGALSKRLVHLDLKNTHGNLRKPEEFGAKSFFNDDTDAMSITTLLEQRMHMILDTFQFYAAMGTPVEFCKRTAFHRFAIDCHIIPNHDNEIKCSSKAKKSAEETTSCLLGSADLDVIFSASAVSHSSDSLTRSEFCCNAMCRIIKRIMKNKDVSRSEYCRPLFIALASDMCFCI